MSFEIREFGPADYEALVEVANAALPAYRESAADWRSRDELRDPKMRFRRWVAESEGRLVGYGEHDQFPWAYEPRKFALAFGVHPDFQRRGIGAALYDTVMEGLRRYDPCRLMGHAREDYPQSVRFLE